ncbi:hypothetical protein [Arthrobacter sp. ok362]|uniref:hypothetical protein n=1 Tax=Arthrobacter sp. ok362 TaxID=1761745 RepID=UPI000B804CD9|nr:hypothetical protein [Arthrobacter sp. ok362]
MSDAEELSKRLQPKITRGGFRVQFVLWSMWTALQLVIVVRNLFSGSVWDLGDYLFLAGLILGVAFLGFLLHVRHHDGHFWEAEETKRDDWDRRGRAL